MGVLSYEAATLLDGHPTPSGDVPVSPSRSWSSVAPSSSTIGGSGSSSSRTCPRAGTTRVEAYDLSQPGWPRPRARAGAAGGRGRRRDRRPEHARRALHGDVGAMKEHIAAGDSTRASPRGVSFPGAQGVASRCTATAGLESRAVHVLRADAGARARRLLPEPLVRVEGRTVTSRPIAGPPTGETDLRDRLYEHELLADPKERAEHAMLVDLARNDLGRVHARDGPPDRAHGRRALLEGHAHREHGRGRARRGHAPTGRARRDLPRRNGDRRAEAPGDGADRGS